MRTRALLPAAALVIGLVTGCTGETGQRTTGDPVTAADAALLAGLLERNHDEGGADFVISAPYGPDSVLTLTGEVDFREAVGRAQVVTSTGGADELRTVFFTRDELWFGDVPGAAEALAGSGATFLTRPVVTDGADAPLVDVLVTVLLGLSAEDGDEPAAFLDGGYTWQGRRSIDGRPTELFGLPGERTLAVASATDVLVQFTTPLPAGDGELEATTTLADHGERSLDLPAAEQSAPLGEHPELAAALGL